MELLAAWHLHLANFQARCSRQTARLIGVCRMSMFMHRDHDAYWCASPEQEEGQLPQQQALAEAVPLPV